jgi:hypothetical protein
MTISEGMGGYSTLAGQSKDKDVSEGLAWGFKKLTCTFTPASGTQ